MKVENISKKPDRLRILIIGRAGAGKTTLLKRICNTTENPEIYHDGDNNILESAGPEPNDISNEIVFKSNEDFVFHNSLGAEADSIEGFNHMKKFVAERTKTAVLSKRIHAIWFCISMDRYHRLVLTAEEKFFDECDTGNVPVVVVFTKCDALEVMAFEKLKPDEMALSDNEKLARMKVYAKEMQENSTAWEKLKERKNPPKVYVHLGNMDKSADGCELLLEKTLEALSKESY